ncbi:MAG: serine/threonine protein kinase, partial [Polyangiaceae bacterium]
MKGSWAYVSGLLDLPKLADPSERLAAWRQSMVTLAHEDGADALEGLHPEALAKAVQTALQAGLVDDLDWLEPAAAGIALYALAAVLPVGTEQRELGRRVLARLNAGNAQTFASMAARMARTSAKSIGATSMRARISLVTELPIGLGVKDGPLALALASGRELAREWIVTPSTGSLPARRLAARLLERAAREAATQAQLGDDHAMRVFRTEAIREAWNRLLDDRESLVWQHVAVARGLIAPWLGEQKGEVTGSLAPTLSPTEWRRGATSLAAMLAVSPDSALKIATIAIDGGALVRDPGVAASFLWGLARAAEAESEAASQLLTQVLEAAPIESAEALVDLANELQHTAFVDRAAKKLAAVVRLHVTKGDPSGDEGRESLFREIASDLARENREDPPVRVQLAAALEAFAVTGAKPAYAAALDVVTAANGAMDMLNALAQDEDAGDRGASNARRTSLAVLRDLDLSLLEQNILSDLLKLGKGDKSGRSEIEPERELDIVRERLASWVLTREGVPIVPGVRGGAPAHVTLRLRRLRALVHLVDGDLGGPDGPRATRNRARWAKVTGALLKRLEAGPPQALRRTLFAALARALDALVRVDALDATDVLLLVSDSFVDPTELATLAEASMDPDLIRVFSRYASFLTACAAAGREVREVRDSVPSIDSLAPPSQSFDPRLRALEELARELFADASRRAEILRTALVRMHASLEAIRLAPSLRALIGAQVGDTDAATGLESALRSIGQLARVAKSRIDPDATPMSPNASPVLMESSMAVSLARVVNGAGVSLSPTTISEWIRELCADVPVALADLVGSALAHLAGLPVDLAPRTSLMPRAMDQLPDWVPARRTLGGFFLVRALGNGAAGSVFVCNRVEDRHDPEAEKFALKVPDYSASAARLISEAEFQKLFRDEAS